MRHISRKGITCGQMAHDLSTEVTSRVESVTCPECLAKIAQNTSTKREVTVTHPDHLPVGKSWAIVEIVNVHIPGDERSRESPGHGYPEHTETYTRYICFHDEAEWRMEIEARSSRVFPGQWFPIAVVRPKLTVRTLIEVGIE